jgi:hypothetical protein
MPYMYGGMSHFMTGKKGRKTPPQANPAGARIFNEIIDFFASGTLCGLNLQNDYRLSRRWRLSRSAIMAINSLFVGLPFIFETV